MKTPEPDPDKQRPLTDEEMTSMLRIPEAEWMRRLDEHCPAGDPEKAELRETLLELRAVQTEYAKTSEAHDKKIEAANETWLQAIADAAESDFEAYKQACKMVREKKAANPFDPRLEEFEELLEQWRSRFPPIDD